MGHSHAYVHPCANGSIFWLVARIKSRSLMFSELADTKSWSWVLNAWVSSALSVNRELTSDFPGSEKCTVRLRLGSTSGHQPTSANYRQQKFKSTNTQCECVITLKLCGIHLLACSIRACQVGRLPVFKNMYFTFFSEFKKHDFFTFFEMTYQKVVKSR